ncbi:hypothetical protein, partial [Aeromonas caviae]|uniref:hypothetical protein n=1 Tax=Aeromonas caviae TaxID=648 RepID=UPI001F414A05
HDVISQTDRRGASAVAVQWLVAPGRDTWSGYLVWIPGRDKYGTGHLRGYRGALTPFLPTIIPTSICFSDGL